jgi:hypothetical protein
MLKNVGLRTWNSPSVVQQTSLPNEEFQGHETWVERHRTQLNKQNGSDADEVQ